MKIRFSIRLRWMMVVIAVFGLVAGVELARQRRDHYREMATEHARAEQTQRFLLGGGVIVSQVGGKVVTLMGPSTQQVPMDGGYTGIIETV